MIVAANWKMNPALDQASALAIALASQSFPQIKRILFAPHPYIVPMSVRLTGTALKLAGKIVILPIMAPLPAMCLPPCCVIVALHRCC